MSEGYAVCGIRVAAYRVRLYLVNYDVAEIGEDSKEVEGKIPAVIVFKSQGLQKKLHRMLYSNIIGDCIRISIGHLVLIECRHG